MERKSEKKRVGLNCLMRWLVFIRGLCVPRVTAIFIMYGNWELEFLEISVGPVTFNETHMHYVEEGLRETSCWLDPDRLQ